MYYARQRSWEFAPVKRQKVNDGPAVPVMALVTDLKWLPGVAGKTIDEVWRDYQWYSGIVNGDVGQQDDAPADGVDDFSNVIT